MDSTRAADLYVSTRPEDHPIANYARDMGFKARTDSIFRVRSQGVMDFQKISYRSKVSDLDIPAYLWQPLRPEAGSRRNQDLRGPTGRP